MGKFTAIEEAVYGIVASPSFVAEKLQVYPNNFTGKITEEFLRLDIITGGENYSALGAKGVLMVQIFVLVNKGTRRACTIADILDKHFTGKSVATPLGTLLLTSSVLSHYGPDKANPALHLSEYTINYSWSNN